MIFNSIAFAIFLIVVFVSYWAIQRFQLRWQNLFLLIASYVFYGWWDWRFLGLIAFSSFVDYTVGLRMDASDDDTVRRRWLYVSLISNLGLLGVFKYYNFFVGSFADLLTTVGLEPSFSTLRIVLPVGISFYTFQTLSYTIDIYWRQLKPTKDIIAFFAFVSFFPQLVAGPIERAAHLLPQFGKARILDVANAKDGLRMMLWGLFKKVVIADNLAAVTDLVFGNYGAFTGFDVALGAFFFALQVYCDFSGYSNMAIGTAKLFGFELSRNFAYPLQSVSIRQLWQNWHISLSSWFRDYVFIPLAFLGHSRRLSMRMRHAVNLMITFVLIGLWHGANWTFVMFGVIQGLLQLPYLLYQKYLTPKRTATILLSIVMTNAVFAFSMIFFRATSLLHALGMIKHMLTESWLATGISTDIYSKLVPMPLLLTFVVGLFVIEYIQRKRIHPLQIADWPVMGRWVAYYGLAWLIFTYARIDYTPFIYFQF